MGVGRNASEVLRLVQAFQYHDKHGEERFLVKVYEGLYFLLRFVLQVGNQGLIPSNLMLRAPRSTLTKLLMMMSLIILMMVSRSSKLLIQSQN